MEKYGDEKSKRLFVKALAKKGFTNIRDADTKENEYVLRPDIYADKDGITYAFELKARKCTSTRYGDILISEHKVNICKSKNVRYYLVFFYYDGVGYIVNPSAEHTVQEFNTAKTTHFSSHTYAMERKAIYQTSAAQRFTFNPRLIYNFGN